MNRATGRKAISTTDESEDRTQNWVPSRPTAVYHQYYGPVNQIDQVNNAHFGVNHGWISQTSMPSHFAGVHGGLHSQPAVPPFDLFSALNPILDASHTRNLKFSPPNSRCFPKTREKVIGMVLGWSKGDLGEANPHILWIYGYAGCGKSAISQAVAEQLAQDGRLAASFFFFRGSGDRSRIVRFVNTLVYQLTRTEPKTAAIIEDVAKADRGLLSVSTTALFAQFQSLFLEPIIAISGSLVRRPLIVVLDGVDECEDKEEVAALFENLFAFLDDNPLFPLRFVITSRVEDHLHRELHASSQVHLLNLVDHTSNNDIKIALDASIAKETRGRAIPGDGSWPSQWDRHRLVQHIGGSYIFMTTIIKLLFAPSAKDGLTPMERLPKILETKPDFDDLYRDILEPSLHFPFFIDIVSTIALAYEPLSIAQIAELLEIKTFNVTNVLVNLHAIMQVPGDDRSPVSLWHTSLRDFLTSEMRAGPLFASPAHHKSMAAVAARIAASSGSSDSQRYSRDHGMDHLFEYLRTVDRDVTCYDGLLGGIVTDLVNATFERGQTALEIACRAQEWKLVWALVDGGANVDTRFQGGGRNIRVALHAVCCRGAEHIAHLLLDKGANPNIVASQPSLLGSWDYDYAVPLAWAAATGNVGLVSKMLACGAEPNLKGGWNDRSALHGCAWENKVEVARTLLKSGADPDARDGEGWTTLHWASRRGVMEIVRCLLSFRANPNIQTNDGRSPLHVACCFGFPEVVQYLLDHNADPGIRDNGGKTPRQVAEESERTGSLAAAEMFFRKGVIE